MKAIVLWDVEDKKEINANPLKKALMARLSKLYNFNELKLDFKVQNEYHISEADLSSDEEFEPCVQMDHKQHPELIF